MDSQGQSQLSFFTQEPATSKLSARQVNLLRSPKKGGMAADEIAEYWGDADIEEIHNRVLEWKAKRR